MTNRVAIAMAAVSIVATLVAGAGAALAQTTNTFRDEFGSISYSGNDGTQPFAGSWQERGESDGTGAGVVRVAVDTRCADGTGNCLRIGSDGGTIDEFAADRSANLEDAESASWSFAWRRKVSGSASTSVRVRISSNGGSTWSTLATIPLSGSQSNQSSSFDISAYATSNTTIRFEGRGSGSNAFLFIDDVTIDASFSATTTTTSSLPSMTSTTTSTTTTIPGPPTSSTTTTVWTAVNPTTTTASNVGASTTTTTSAASSTTTSADTGVPNTSTTTKLSATTNPNSQGSSTDTTPAPSTMGDESASADDGASQTAAGEADRGTVDPNNEVTLEAAASLNADSSPNDVSRLLTFVIVQLVLLGTLAGVLAAVGVDGPKP